LADESNLKQFVAEVAAAYFSNNHVTPAEIPNVVAQIARSLSGVTASGVAPPDAAEGPAPESDPPVKLTPSQVRKSITRDALISFEDNRPYKTLRRHLSVRGLTPDQYRAKWGLPGGYPMVAPSYSEARSTMAKALGLGNLRRAAVAEAAGAPPRRGGRRPKAEG